MSNKRVGIITYFYFYNYGTMLQGLATQLLFNKYQDVDAELIDCRFGAITIEKKIDVLKIRFRRMLVYFKEFRRVYYTRKYSSLMRHRHRFFDDFVTNYFRLSRKTYLYDNEIANDVPVYDIYVTGSDQTWSPKITFSPALFLDFAPTDSIKSSYAPSLGVSSLSKDESERIGRHLRKYDFLSCRESMGSEMLHRITGKPVETVLDPTLMIEADEWMKYAVEPSIKGKYILCYFLGDRDYYRNYVRQLSKQTGLPVYYIPVNWKDFRRGNNLLWETGPSEFLGLIANAEYVCTDSFHGTIFSVNFHKEVHVFVKHAGNVAGGDNSRLFDVLKRLGIEKQLVTEYEVGAVIPDTCIDYPVVDGRLAAERNVSRLYVEKIVNAAK